MEPPVTEVALRRSTRKRSAVAVEKGQSPPASPKRRKVDTTSLVLAPAFAAESVDVVQCIGYFKELGLASAVRVWVLEITGGNIGAGTASEAGNGVGIGVVGTGAQGGKAVVPSLIWQNDHATATRHLAKCYRSIRRLECVHTLQFIGTILESWTARPFSIARDVWNNKLRNADPRVFLTEDRQTGNEGDGGVSGGRRIRWAAAGAAGWTENGNGGREPLHPYVEDVFYIPLQRRVLIHRDSKSPIPIFALADGHGGRYAAEWFIKRLPARVKELLVNHKEWNFDDESHRRDLSAALQDTFIQMDREFCNNRKAEYEAFQQRKTSPNSKFNTSNSTTPWDDGCTLNLVVIMDGWFISAHVGDSRTVLGQARQAEAVEDERNILNDVYDMKFATTDHSPAHPERALAIHKAGGVFKEWKNTPPIPITFTSPDSTAKDEEPKLSYETIRALESARVFRPTTFVHPYGLPVKNLSLSDAMGDVTMKFPPALFSGKPDVEIVKFDPDERYVVLMASDGIWTYLKEDNGSYAECMSVLEAVGERHVWEASVSDGREDLWGAGDRTLQKLAASICARREGPFRDMFFEAEMWDDVSVIVVEIGEAGSDDINNAATPSGLQLANLESLTTLLGDDNGNTVKTSSDPPLSDSDNSDDPSQTEFTAPDATTPIYVPETPPCTLDVNEVSETEEELNADDDDHADDVSVDLSVSDDEERGVGGGILEERKGDDALGDG
ncbi:hypothetical protein HDV00_012079 [Rhizophlyctis rosea]|nr:hypothetical protein HDV00_012079 [Rhizophlyctis rosea]